MIANRAALVGFLILATAAAHLAHTESAAKAPSPPGQPGTGPGGAEYRHESVRKTVHGEGAQQFWLYEPAEPAPASAPFVVFNHGWGATNPRAYGAWIEHIVRRGNIVVYPAYQNPGTWRYPPKQITPNAIQATKEAIRVLRSGDHVRPDLGRTAVVGHSAGGQISANMAALASANGLPHFKAVMSVQPGKSWTRLAITAITLEDMSLIPPSTLMICVAGDRDTSARDVDAKRIFKESTRVPMLNKDFVTVVTDEHGGPALIADHFSPVAPNASYDSGIPGATAAALPGRSTDIEPEDDDWASTRVLAAMSRGGINALDFYAYWKLFDGLYDAAFGEPSGRKCFGGTTEQRFMGRWSDGVAVKELVVTDQP